MQKYVVTGFDEQYWHQWGASWLASLVEISHFGGTEFLSENLSVATSDGHILVVSHNLSSSTKNRIIESGGSILPALGKYDDIRSDTLATISSCGINGIFAYWDADVYFQDKIDDVFSLNQDKFVLTKNPGFICGPHFLWPFLGQLLELASTVEKSPKNAVTHLTRYHPNLVHEADDEWNFTDLPHLRENEGKLVSKKCSPRAIHPQGNMKSFLTGRDILFWERRHDLWAKYSDSQRKSSRKLVMK